MKSLRLCLLTVILSPLLAVAGQPSPQWNYPLAQPLAGPVQVYTDGSGGAAVLMYVMINATDTDTILVWLDDDGAEFYRKVFHQNSSFYFVGVTRENLVVAVNDDQHFLVVSRRGVETIIPNVTGNGAGAVPMSWTDEKGFFLIRDPGQPTASLVRYRFR